MVLETALATNAKVSSVGASWPPAFDQRNSRVKGICPRVIDSQGKLVELFHQVSQAENSNPESTRTTFRAFVRSDLVEGIRRDSTTSYPVEAVIPANYAVQGCDLVYFGKNLPQRNPGAELRQKEEASLRRVQDEVHLVEPHVAMARVITNGYHISMLNGERTPSDINDMVALYREAYDVYTFEVNEVTINYMIGNSNKVVVGRHMQGEHAAKIASVLIAEHCTITLEDGRIVNMYELSDFATYRRARGNGLITAMQQEAVSRLRSTPEGANAIIYAEDRAPWEPVNKSSKEAGLHYGGTLLYACKLLADRSIKYANSHESLNVWHAPMQ